MSAIPSIPSCGADGPIHSEQCPTMTTSGGQLVDPEDTRPCRGTDGTLDSTTCVASEKCDQLREAETVELQLSPVSTLASHPSSTTVDGTIRPTNEQSTSRRWQRFRLQWFSAYRVLMSVAITVNLGAMTAQLISEPTVEAPLTATAANITAAVLLRQEELINLGFKLVSKLPPSLPLFIRRAMGDFHHFGGLHIGCALSALLWYVTFTVLNTIRVLHLLSLRQMTAALYIDITTSYTVLLTILAICLTALPRFRTRSHNTFEATHRFGGWAALLTLWLHSGISSLTPGASAPHTHPALWLLALTTILIALPWLRMRRVPITAHRISPRETALSFPHPHMPHTTTLRFSTAPLREWHAFATIPGATTSTVIVSTAGDWTSRIHADPPAQLWIRDPPVLNFLALVPLFRTVLLVATGAGIAPCMSLLASPVLQGLRRERGSVRIMWCVAEPEAAHWGFVVEAIRGVDEAAVIFDSRVARPDIAFEARLMAERAGVEAVFVVSNPKVTGEVVRACKGGGIAAYGAVFDS